MNIYLNCWTYGRFRYVYKKRGNYYLVRFEVLTAVVRSVVWKSQWELAVHFVLRVSQRKLTCCLAFPSRFLYNPKFRQADCSSYLLQAGFLICLFFDPEDGSDVPPKRRLTFNGLHGVISQRQNFCNYYLNGHKPLWWVPRKLHATIRIFYFHCHSVLSLTTTMPFMTGG
jgi:hypothetical protein